MSSPGCNREPEIRTAFDTDSWSEDLREHLGECEACADQILVTRALATAVVDLEPESPLPDPRQIWWRAQVAGQASATAKATRIISIMQWIAVAIGSAVGMGLLASAWPAFRSWFEIFANVKAFAPSGTADPVLVITASAVILVVMVFLDLNAEWVRPRRG